MLNKRLDQQQDILNADLDLRKPHKNNSGQTEKEVLAACEGEIERTLIKKGTVLYKFSNYPGFSPTNNNLSEWWFTPEDLMSLLRYIEGSVINQTANQQILSLEEKGESFDSARLAAHLQQQDMRYIVRHAAAICQDWNSLGFLQAIQLTEDVYGFQSFIAEQPRISSESAEPRSVRFEAPASIEEPAAQERLSGGLRQTYVPFLIRDQHAIESKEFNGSCSMKMEDVHNHLIWLNTRLGQAALLAQTRIGSRMNEAQSADMERLSRMEADKKSGRNIYTLINPRPSIRLFSNEVERKHSVVSPPAGSGSDRKPRSGKPG